MWGTWSTGSHWLWDKMRSGILVQALRVLPWLSALLGGRLCLRGRSCTGIPSLFGRTALTIAQGQPLGLPTALALSRTVNQK